MRPKTNLFKINGQKMLTPDSNMSLSYSDLDDKDTGRDEDGYMHRIVVRQKVLSVPFEYKHLTAEEYQYMESLFSNASTFEFTHPSRENPATPEVTTCYRSKYGISYVDASSGQWANYKFSIIEC